ncbi:MAG: bifunctional isocitrate dehydrogenase kinase/phosphatase, partial [Candidatus Competibacteraceae bacterium]|nr:bifunctional isocitrate dehydrogenase kinase/phosphatase [Candidatus Competibacteraceae bacterium]
TDFRFGQRFEHLRRDLRYLLIALAPHIPQSNQLQPNFQIQLLSSPFYRNKAAYLVGRIINGHREQPFVIPVLQNEQRELYIDTILFDSEDLSTLFSFARAYFMVDMEVPSAYVDFLSAILPRKPRAELYTLLGLQKQGKTMFFRDLQHHLKHSTDAFTIAPGIKGMVMLVFTLPSFPYVFKIIKDV